MKNHDTTLFRSNYFYGNIIILMEIFARKILSISDLFHILFVLRFAQDDSVLVLHIYFFSLEYIY